MTTLHLTLKKQWFDMTEIGVKKEEYREIKPYWIKRFVYDAEYTEKEGAGDFIDDYGQEYTITKFKKFTHTYLANGYGKKVPSFTIENLGIRVGRGNPEWGAPVDRDVFIISHGKIVQL